MVVLWCTSFAVPDAVPERGTDAGEELPHSFAALTKLNPAIYPDALCMDGTPGAYYFRQGSASAGSWVVSLEGGGECVTDGACRLRPEGLKSSGRYGAVMEPWGLLSADEGSNPDFARWNHVYVKYCSGDLHLGNMNASSPLRWGWARFAGAAIVEAVLQDLLRNHGLASAKLVIWSGESAGGIGSVAHLDSVAALLKNAKVVGAPIAGYYWDNAHPYTGPGAVGHVNFSVDAFKYYHSLWQAQVPQSCAKGTHSLEPWACMLAAYAFSTIKSPIFVIESEIDSVQLALHSGVVSCLGPASTYCAEFGANMTRALLRVVARAKANSSAAGLFAPACYLHTGFTAQRPLIDSRSYIQALGDWLLRGIPVALKDECCNTSKVHYNPTCP